MRNKMLSIVLAAAICLAGCGQQADVVDVTDTLGSSIVEESTEVVESETAETAEATESVEATSETVEEHEYVESIFSEDAFKAGCKEIVPGEDEIYNTFSTWVVHSPYTGTNRSVLTYSNFFSICDCIGPKPKEYEYNADGTVKRDTTIVKELRTNEVTPDEEDKATRDRECYLNVPGAIVDINHFGTAYALEAEKNGWEDPTDLFWNNASLLSNYLIDNLTVEYSIEDVVTPYMLQSINNVAYPVHMIVESHNENGTTQERVQAYYVNLRNGNKLVIRYELGSGYGLKDYGFYDPIYECDSWGWSEDVYHHLCTTEYTEDTISDFVEKYQFKVFTDLEWRNDSVYYDMDRYAEYLASCMIIDDYTVDGGIYK